MSVTVQRSGVRAYPEFFIGGIWAAPSTGRHFDSVDPATGQTWATIPQGGAQDIDAAVKAAHATFASSEWRGMTGSQRGGLLFALADAIEGRAEKLAGVESRDNGKPIRETRDREFAAIPAWFRYYAALADKIEGLSIPVGQDMSATTVRQPFGVIGAILPWNSPTLVLAWKLAPALAAGNTVVVKPSEFTSASALELARLVEEVDFPAGAVNVVTGLGSEAGEALARHPGVAKLTLTGSGRTASAVTRASADTLKPLAFELGGNSPHILFADADYKQALAVAVEGAFIASGQSCTAGSRVLVASELSERFVADFVAAAESIRLGDPLDEATQMGPVANRPQLEKIERMVAEARAAGARVAAGGRRVAVDGLPGGFFYAPTVLVDVGQDMAICREEIFGPVATIQVFDDETEALALANDTSYGLTAGLWTNDIRRANRMSSALEVGTVWVNTYRQATWAVPYGGFKMSGYGRENGRAALDEYTQIKSIVTDHREARPSWFHHG